MNDIIEEHYGWDGLCQHGINKAACNKCRTDQSEINKPNNSDHA